MKTHVTKEELIGLLPPGDTIHTFIETNGMLIGADWSREKIINAIQRADIFGITGDLARGYSHGIYCAHPSRPDITLFVATRGEVHGGDEPDWGSFSFEGRH